MERVLGGLAIVAAVLLTAAILMGAGPFADGLWNSISHRGSRLSIDVVSFALGFAACLVAVWVMRVPWGDIPRRILASIVGWRRHAMFMGLAVLSAGVILFY